MKFTNKIYTALAIIGMSSSMTACLNDDEHLHEFTNVGAVVELLKQNGPYFDGVPLMSSETITGAVDLAPSTDYELRVNVASPYPLDENVDVTMAIDPAILAKYNADGLKKATEAGETWDDYVILPSTLYSFTPTVTVAGGKRASSFMISIKAADLFADPDKGTYLLPVKIASASSNVVVSGNLSSALLFFTVKNKYDGKYDILGGSITRNSATGPDLALGGDYKAGLTMDLTTIDGTKCGFAPLFKTGAGIGGVAGTNLVVDPVTNLVTVTSTGNATLKNTPGKTNSYDPATKTFTLNFDWGVAPNTRIIADLKLKYKGSR